MQARLCALIFAVALSACGKSPEEPLEPAPVADLQGPWLMINRSSDCTRDYTLFSPHGLFRVYGDKRPRKQYIKISKFVLEAGKITLEAPEFGAPDIDVGSLVFSFQDKKLRLIDILSPKGTSYSKPPANIASDVQEHLKNLVRINELRFAMDRCPGA